MSALQFSRSAFDIGDIEPCTGNLSTSYGWNLLVGVRRPSHPRPNTASSHYRWTSTVMVARESVRCRVSGKAPGSA